MDEENDAYAPLGLGGISNGVTNLELTGAYAAIANGGVYTQPILYSKIWTRTAMYSLTMFRRNIRP